MTKELAWDIAQTAHALRRYYDRRVAAFGVTRSQWRVLLSLAREPGLKQVELADRLDVEPITLCRIVDRLEDAGLVERSRDPDDRRAWRLANTDKARPLLETLRLVADEMAEMAFAGLDHGQRAMMRTALGTVRDNLLALQDKIKVTA